MIEPSLKVCGPFGTRLKAKDPASVLVRSRSVQTRGPEVRRLSRPGGKCGSELVWVQVLAFPLVAQ